ncbi:MAG: hydroxymethylbilane synthase [Clostridia bacterium]|nr:hydroxymethylbilane synthase [Clostridia bacterium]MDH7573428.1 hydroxymethylbilane synthase [Clostridia bacterium]
MARKTRITIGTRGSELARRQADYVGRELLRYWPGLEVSFRIVRTRGDKLSDVPLAKIGGRGVFVKELEQALLAGQVDLAVHSLKDLPTEPTPGLILAAVTERADPRDALVCPAGLKFSALPPGARLGTASLRRQAQLRHWRPDLVLEDLRGNIPTRLLRMQERRLDGIVVAAAALERLGLADRITEYLSHEICLPAAGQGALALQARAGDEAILELVRPLHHAPTGAAVTAERAFLAALQGGCQVPAAAHAYVEEGALYLEGLVAGADGRELIRGERHGAVRDAESLGRALAGELLARGGEGILGRIRPSGGKDMESG